MRKNDPTDAAWNRVPGGSGDHAYDAEHPTRFKDLPRACAVDTAFRVGRKLAYRTDAERMDREARKRGSPRK